MAPHDPPELRTPRILLRPFRAADAVDRAGCGDDPAILRLFGASVPADHDPTMTVAQAEAWLAPILAERSPTHWAIEHAGRFIGTVRLHGIDPVDRRARFAIGILDPAVLGIGLGTEATAAVLDYGFEALGLHRIDLRVLAINERAIRCYLRCGFVEEGRERESALIDGRWHDDVMMSVLDREWATRTGGLS